MDFNNYLIKYHSMSYEEYLEMDCGNREYYFDEYKRYAYGQLVSFICSRSEEK